jgi:hypothetical protein
MRRLSSAGLLGLVSLIFVTGFSPASARTVALNEDQSDRFVRTMVSVGTDTHLLGQYPGITPDVAARIVAFRKSGKSFTTIAEFRQASGISDENFDKLATHFTRLRRVAGSKQEQADAATSPTSVKPPSALGSRRGSSGLAGKTQNTPPSKASAEGPKLDLEVQSSYYSVLPGYDLTKVDTEKKKRFLDTINSETCSCGCSGETLGYCLVNDPGCPVVKSRVRKIFTDIVGAGPAAPAGSGAGH